jgi:GGDEF domain-containing protein
MDNGKMPPAGEEVFPMQAARFPAYLQPVPRHAAEPGTAPTAPARRLLSRVELLRHLDAQVDLAPRAPLSLLAVRVTGLDDVLEERGEVGVRFVSRGVGEALLGLCRGTDLPGEMGEGTFGVVLQGSGTTAAAAAAARVQHHLNRLAFLPAGCAVLVGAATGTGSHGRRLAWAALEMFDRDCCGG